MRQVRRTRTQRRSQHATHNGRLMDAGMELTGRAARAAHTAVDAVSRRVTRGAETAAHTGRRAVAALEERIVARPLTYTAIAFAAGMIAHTLFRWRGRRD